MSNNTAILFVGYPAAGKSTALDAVTDLGIPGLEMSTVAAWKFEQFNGRPPRGDDLRHFGVEQRRAHHQGIFGHWAVKYVQDRLGDPEVFAVSGIRSPGEIIALQREVADSYVLLVDTPFSTRLERIQQRGREGEEEFTKADLYDRDEEERGWGVDECIDMADDALLNWSYTEDEFRDHVQAQISPLLGP